MRADLTVLSLGGGVQSSSLALMAAQGVIERPGCAIYADTGWDAPDVAAMVEWLQSTLPYPLEVVSAGSLPDDLSAPTGRRAFIPAHTLSRAHGVDGLGRRQCTREYKVDPINRRIREMLGAEKGQRLPANSATVWLGISTDEVERCRDSKDRWRVNRWPLIERQMSRADCEMWWHANAPKGAPPLAKSSCVGCPFHSTYEWARLQERFPEAVAHAARVERAIQARDEREGSVSVSYLHRRRIPLLEALDADRQQGVLFDDDGWGMECEGMCGV